MKSISRVEVCCGLAADRYRADILLLLLFLKHLIIINNKLHKSINNYKFNIILHYLCITYTTENISLLLQASSIIGVHYR